MIPFKFARRAASILSAAALALVIVVPHTAAGAPAPSTIGISPVGTSASYFTVTMKPGTSRQLVVEYADHGTAPAEASTYAADVYTSVNGGFAAELQGKPIIGTTTWLAYPSTTISLGAGKSQQRSFTLSVPAGTQPGEHITSLIIQYQVPGSTKGPVTLNQVSREALPIVIEVPGPRSPAMSLGANNQSTVDGRTDLSVAITNSGNVRIHPTGQFVVSNAKGANVATAQVTMGTIYPSDATTARVLLSMLLPPGQYSLTASFTDATLGISADANEGLDVAASPVVHQIPTPKSVPTLASPVARSISIELIAGLILGSILVGVGATYGVATLRRRRNLKHVS